MPAGEQNYAFVGWAVESVEDTATEPAFYGPGCELAVSEDMAFYAVYTYTVGGTGTTEYVLTDLENIQDTDTVVITVERAGTIYALDGSGGTSTRPAAVVVNAANGKLTSAPTETLQWNVISVG